MMAPGTLESDLETTPTRGYDVSTMPQSSTAPFTWRDAQRMPDDGNRYEAIGGKLYMTPPPSIRHHRLTKRLFNALKPLLVDAGRGELFWAPVGVEFPATGEGVEPDLLFVSNEQCEIVQTDWIRGAPHLVVEILSPSTASRDRAIKRRLYERQGVAEYWIVDPEANSVDVWRFGDDPEWERFRTTLPVRLGTEQVGVIDLGPVFLPEQGSPGPRPSTARFTWQDAQRLPEDGNRYEAIGGELYMTPAQTYRHQRVSRHLVAALDHLLNEPERGLALFGPVGVEFPATDEGVQPDLLFVSNERRGIISDDWIRGAPDLMVEILSPSTASRDRGIKRQLYERQGVREYWIVDPDANAVDVWRFGEEPAHERFEGTLPVRLGAEEVGVIDLEAVFAPDL